MDRDITNTDFAAQRAIFSAVLDEHIIGMDMHDTRTA